MKTNVTRILIGILLICIGVIKTRRFQILYDAAFSQDMLYLKTFPQNDSVVFTAYDKHSNLQDMLQENDDAKHDIILSFTGVDLLLHETRKSVNNHYRFGKSIHELESQLLNTPYEECVEQSAMHRQSILFLIYSLSVNGVAIITDSDYCSRTFVVPLTEDLRKKEQNSKIRFSIQPFQLQSHNDVELKEYLYSLRTTDVPLIVLLAKGEYYNRIFQMAATFGLTGTSQIWLIPHFKDDKVSTPTPTKILSFEREHTEVTDEIYVNLAQTIPKMLEQVKQAPVPPDGIIKENYILPRLYETVRQNEHTNVSNIRVTINYRNLAEKEAWVSVPASVRIDSLILERNDIPILRTFVGDDLFRYVRAVTILDEPFTFEDSQIYNAKDRSCQKGLLCKKIFSQNGGQKLYVDTCCIGYIIETFKFIMADLNIFVDLYIVEDGKYGAVENGRWNGMIGDLVDDKYDVAIAGLTITEDRLEVVDFSVAYQSDKMGILVKPQVVTFDFINWQFIAPLTSDLQLMLIFSVIGAIFINYLLENNVYLLSLFGGKKPTDKYYSLCESMSYISGVTLQRDLGGANPGRAGARIAVIVFAFGMVIVVTTYTAVLAAQSVQNQEKDPFKGSQDERLRNPTDDYRFATLKSSSYTTFFENGETEILKRMGKFMEKYNYDSTPEAVKMLQNGTLHALITDYQFLYYYLSKEQSCDLKLVEDNLLQFGLGFAFTKSFPWKVLVNQAILKHIDLETFNTLYKKWVTNICTPQIYASTKNQLSINRFGGIILILIVTALLTFVLQYPEYLYWRHLNGKIADKIINFFHKPEEMISEEESGSAESSVHMNEQSPVFLINESIGLR